MIQRDRKRSNSREGVVDSCLGRGEVKVLGGILPLILERVGQKVRQKKQSSLLIEFASENEIASHSANASDDDDDTVVPRLSAFMGCRI